MKKTALFILLTASSILLCSGLRARAASTEAKPEVKTEAETEAAPEAKTEAETEAKPEKIVLRLMGDSTMADKDLDKRNPERGWGQRLPADLDTLVTVVNYAKNGRSTKSFISEGRWDKVKADLKAGEWLFIEFGHNDAKTEDSLRYAPARGLYTENLRTFASYALSVGAHPVILSPVMRRDFDENGNLNTEGHGDYPAAAREVADELGIPFIDAKSITQKWLMATGDEASRPYYMWVEPGTNPRHPDGLQDNTHTNAKGARNLVSLLLPAICDVIPALTDHVLDYDFVVAKDGSGDFFTIQEAVDAAPSYLKQDGVSIRVRPGVYRETVTIPANKDRLHIVGDDPLTTILTYDNYAEKVGSTGYTMGTSATPTLFCYGDNLLLENITVENTSGEGREIGQACALLVDADRCAFIGCRFIANQDTIYTYGDGQRQYFRDCWIEGTTDFIFGASTAWFEHCTILSKKDSYITAASTHKERPFGYVFHDCTLIAAPGITKCYLGRPWRQYAKTVYLDCELGSHILPEGWHNWNKIYAEKTTFYAESGCTGPGADTKDRVGWSHPLTKHDLLDYTPANVLDTGLYEEDKDGQTVKISWYYKVF